ncbi:sugar ABC transporter permease [Promicromonospora sp. NPDC023987]|uniref:carbohydrate ABC transporter permease n=1 Tax=Promicromonospora sp. NPDC023987 TaxID=3155360 RepID=UPI0033D88B2F
MTATDVATRRPGTVRPTRRPGHPRRVRDGLTGWGFVAPATLIVLGLSIFPAVWAFLLSLQDWNGFSTPEAVGFDNYREMAADPDLGGAALHTLLYTALFVPASVLLGLGLAVALNRRIVLVGLYRTLIFLPFVVSAAATGILTTYLFNPQFGLVNNVLRAIGLPPQGWLEDPNQAMVVLAIMSLWGQAAFTTVIYLAALQDIPAELTEAARVDGANRWQSFWHVTFPQLAPVTVFVSIWQTIQAIQLFDLVYTTTRGGPLGATETIVYYLWTSAFKDLEFGYASAVAYGLFAVTLAITIGVTIYSRRSTVGGF